MLRVEFEAGDERNGLRRAIACAQALSLERRCAGVRRALGDPGTSHFTSSSYSSSICNVLAWRLNNQC